MRFIIHQQPYERPIVAGQLQYEHESMPTGAQERFLVTAAVDGYRFLRVDLDARSAPSRWSTLYHMTLDPDGRPQQLKYRFWGGGLEIAGAVVWDELQLTATREVNGLVYQDEADADVLWFPAGAGLALLRPQAGTVKARPAVTLNQDIADPARMMALLPVLVSVRPIEAIEVTVTGATFAAAGYDIAWNGQERRVWLHQDGWPLRVWRDDGLTATITQLVGYH